MVAVIVVVMVFVVVVGGVGVVAVGEELGVAGCMPVCVFIEGRKCASRAKH